MDNRREARDFLVSRRAKVTPDQVGLPTGANRRVPGLRRSEVATLAGVSVEYYADPSHRANLARYCFLDPAARRFYPDRDLAADMSVAILRTEAGRDPHDKDLHDLVGELSTRSDHFRTRWGTHDVRHHGTGTKRFHHHIVGDLELAYEGLELVAEPGLTLTIYTAEPHTPSHDALQLLASWAVTHPPEHLAPPKPHTETH